MDEIKQAIMAYLSLLSRDELKLVYLLIRKLAKK